MNVAPTDIQCGWLNVHGVYAMLEANVLVLNNLWQAVNICSAKRAFCLLYQGHARVVTEDGGTFNTFSFDDWKDFSFDARDVESVRTVSFKVRVPRIILLLVYDHLPQREVKFTRRNIYERDGNRCQYCGKKFDTKELNLDHVVPLARGGKTTWENVVCSCMACNTRKGGRLLSKAGMKLICKPRKPRWQAFVLIKFSSNIDESWRHFIDVAYWNVELGEEVR